MPDSLSYELECWNGSHMRFGASALGAALCKVRGLKDQQGRHRAENRYRIVNKKLLMQNQNMTDTPGVQIRSPIAVAPMMEH